MVATKVEVEYRTGTAKVYLGFATEIEPGWKGVVVPRSSFTQKGWVMQNSPAQIDSDYRGEWMLKFQAIPASLDTFCNKHEEIELEYPDFPYKPGDRVAQIYFEEVKPVEFTVVFDEEELSSTERGDGGFGSTGV